MIKTKLSSLFLASNHLKKKMKTYKNKSKNTNDRSNLSFETNGRDEMIISKPENLKNGWPQRLEMQIKECREKFCTFKEGQCHNFTLNKRLLLGWDIFTNYFFFSFLEKYFLNF